jgi:glycerate kinase
MRILIACDSFKDALPAHAVCQAIAQGVARAYPDAAIIQMPLSDGGEGVLEVLSRALSLKSVTLNEKDALGRPVKAHY